MLFLSLLVFVKGLWIQLGVFFLKDFKHPVDGSTSPLGNIGKLSHGEYGPDEVAQVDIKGNQIP